MGTYKISINGFEITASSAKDVADLICAMTEATPTAPTLKHDEIRKTTKKCRCANHAGDAIHLLTAIATDVEADTQTLQAVLHVTVPQGIGAKVRWIQMLIEELGFNLNEVFTRRFNGEGWIWAAGPRIEETISALRALQHQK